MLLPLGLDVLRFFSDELVKISDDAGTRATLAGKTGQGQTYLVGGELPSNSPTQTNFVPKIAEEFKPKIEEFKAQETADRKKKVIDFLRNARDKGEGPTVAALTGAGGGILAGQLITGGRLGGLTGATRLGYRGFGAIGAGLGLAKHLGTKHLDNKGKKKATMPKTAGLATNFSPARKLSSGMQTGSFKNIVHSSGSLQPSTVGQKFLSPK